jgi:1,2-diacylglycerol 3-beta-galactosyltransferase
MGQMVPMLWVFLAALVQVHAATLRGGASAPATVAVDTRTGHRDGTRSRQRPTPNRNQAFVETVRQNLVQGRDNVARLLQRNASPSSSSSSSSSSSGRRNGVDNAEAEIVAKSSLPAIVANPLKRARSLFATRGGGGGGANKKKKKRVLILMSDTGGGHRASAVAIDKAMQERIPGKVDVKIMDIWTDHATWPFHNFVPYYRFLAKYPLLWRGMYLYGAFPPTKLFTETWSWLACYKSFRKAIVDADPDLVVSVHPLCQLMPISIVKEMNKVRSPDRLPIPFVTVVTDLGGAHSTWFDRRADLCFVPSEAVRKVALKNRVPETKIVMHGLPIRPAFWKASKSKHVLRKALDLTQKVKTVLLMGGGDGVGGLEQIAVQMSNRLGESKKDSQVVVICGHNKRTSDNLKARKYPPNVRVVVRGFQKNIDEFMAACDVLVTKAGPGTYCTGHALSSPSLPSSSPSSLFVQKIATAFSFSRFLQAPSRRP